MDDDPSSRLLRFLLTGVLVLFSWGVASSVVEDARTDAPSSQMLARASGVRVAANRFSGDLSELPALPAPRIEAEVADAGEVAVAAREPRATIRSRPANPARLPRAPPAAPLPRID